MKSAHEIVQEIVAAGGSLWFDGYRVRGRNIPRRLAVLVKADEGGILAAMFSKQPLVAPLPSESMDDTTPTEKMQHRADMAPQSDQELSPQDVKTINDWLTHIGETDTALIATLFKCCKSDPVVLETTLKLAAEDPPKIWVRDYKGQSPDEWKVVAPLSAPAPAAVTCGQCSQFQPGPQPLSIGVCLVTSHGLPPKGGSGSKAAYPMAPRTCPNYEQEKN